MFIVKSRSAACKTIFVSLMANAFCMQFANLDGLYAMNTAAFRNLDQLY